MFSTPNNWTPEQYEAFKQSLPITLPKSIGPYPPGIFRTQAGVAEMVAHFQESAKENLDRHGNLEHIALVFVTCYPASLQAAHEVIAMSIKGSQYSDRAKEMLSQSIRTVATAGKACAVFMVSEAWINTGTDMEALDKWRDEHGGSLEGHPNTEEVAMLIVELPDSSQIYTAPIHRTSDGKRTLGAWDKHPASGGVGRFVGLLHPEVDPSTLS